MTTPRHLLVISMDAADDHPVRSGELSLALAGAELIDLFRAGAVEVREDRVVPARPSAPADGMLERAFASLRREEPYESVGDWLWRRGEGLADAYTADFEAAGLLTRRRRRGHPFQAGDLVLENSAVRSEAARSWSSADPVLVTLATTVGVPGDRVQEAPSVTDDTVASILAGVGDATLELEAERQRRDIERKAFDNVWRGPGL
ncbi:GPP34 family phosphoprotein [Streptomyces sp. NPDC007088]|uniref:GOLPH3/VPS74 family protein n=1 Tax=Streptomyces sp. NPDC007088 TaxID=3364773 RepID=UPI0036A0AFD9